MREPSLRLTTLALAAAIGLVASPLLAQVAAPAPEAAAPDADHLSIGPAKPGHARPLVVVVGENMGAETTDFIVPYGILKASGLFDVRAVSTGAGPITLRASITILADQTLAAFDAASPEGADIVIVPAQMDARDAGLNAWLRDQAARGATIVSICDGAQTVARAGLFDGRRATGHWASLAALEKAYPHTEWVRDRRFVQDGRIISTTGVSASIPVSLALIEAVGGHDAAVAAAAQAGAADWSAAHRTADYQISAADYSKAAGLLLAGWTHETVELPLAAGDDEIALALRADAWRRSYRTKVVISSADLAPVRSLHGLMIVPDAKPARGSSVVPAPAGPPVAQLDATLAEMGRRYGPIAVRLATAGMEYPTPASAAAAGQGASR